MSTILIVDDRTDNRDVLTATLGHLNHRLLEASRGEEALTIARREKPDLIISDVLMPKMDGFEFVQQLRRDPELAHTTVVFYTANYIEEESRSLAKACGVNHIIVKPAEPEEILKTIDAALGEKGPSENSTPAKDFAREHLHLVTDKLAQKVEELEKLNTKLEGEIAERTRIEEELRSTHEQLRQLLGHTPAVIYSLRVDGQSVTPVFVSENIERLLGVTAAESKRSEWWSKNLHPGDRERVLNTQSKSLSGDGYSMEYRIRHKDGSYHWVEDNNRLVRNALGEATESVGVWTDITERRFADEAMRASEQRFSSFMDNVPGFAWMKDAEGRYLYGNKLLQELLLPGPEWRGRTVEEVWPSEIAAPLRANDEKVIQTKAPLQIVEMVEQSGEKRAVLSSKFPILNGNGEVAFVCGIGIDITERKQAEERLREQADIINRAHDAIIIRNFKDRRIVFWNSGAERLYGWTAAEMMGQVGQSIFTDPKEIETLMTSLLSSDEYRGEVKQATKDGKELITEGRATLIRNPDGSPRSILIICTDITEQKKLETHLLRAQRLESIGTLASGVAHDLNNILTPILVCAEVIKGNPLREDLPALISLIEESAKRGANVVRQVLTFARGIEGERIVVKPSYLIQELIALLESTFPKAIEILSRCPDGLWSIKCDPTQLHQVLLNLSVNARDAMPSGGSITIGAENFEVDEHYASMTPGAKPGPHVMFRVTDTGAGMSRAIIDKIFDPFFTTKEVGKGTGLGLSTTLGIIKSHGGFISVSSEIGTGTTFKVFLPAQVSEASPRKSAASPEPLNGKGELILVVDDEVGIRRVSKIILETHNYRVLLANDGREALGLFPQQMGSINAVLTDITMPYVDGVALIRAIKKMEPGMAFIASTGQDDVNRVSELQALGVSNFLGKPYDTKTLLTKVRDSLSTQAKS
jgi:PAS domain S-box-containing protein